jgi:ATP-dependent exoDNAse (exonuclease V) beta subunit
MLHLSQSHLNLLETCPPKFQQVYLERLASLPDPQQQESLAWGSRFHLLMQQRELGLPIKSLLENDRELNHAVTTLIEATPELWENQSETWREAEHCRTLSNNNCLLTVIYDLLIAQRDRAIILDWKSYRHPPSRRKLAHNWQTRLYLYALVETSDYSPEQVALTYWFVKSSDTPESLTFNYSKTQHQKTKKDLQQLLDQLQQWLDSYQQGETAFPHHLDCETRCPFANSLLPPSPDNLALAIADIAEISI